LKRNFRVPSFIMIALFFCLALPLPTFASGSIVAIQQPTVPDNKSVELGTIRVDLDAASLKKGDAVVIQFSEFASFGSPFEPNVQSEFRDGANRLVVPSSFNGETNWTGQDSPFQIQTLDENRIVLESTSNQNLDKNLVFLIQLGNIDIKEGSYGAVNVTLEPSPGSGFPSGKITVGNINGIKHTLSITSGQFAQHGDLLSFNLNIKEDQPGAFNTGNPIHLILPNGFVWDQETVSMNKGATSDLKLEADNQELKITSQGHNQSSNASSWQIPIQFKVADQSAVLGRDIKLKVEWGTTQELLIGSYTKPKQKETVVFKVGSLVYIDGQIQIGMDVTPYITNGRTFLPIRYVAEALGVSAEHIVWDNASQTATILQGSKQVKLKIGSNVLIVNGNSVVMDIKPELRNDRLMIPIRYISEAFGNKVTWDQSNQSITIEKE
jgi:hypothetical protein